MSGWLYLMYLFSNMVFAETVGEFVIPDYNSAAVTTTAVPSDPSPKSSDSKTITVWQNYFNQLSTCAPGTFELPQINPHLAKQYGNIQTNKINGATNGHCEVVMMYYSETDPRLERKSLPENQDQIKQYPAGQLCRLSKMTADAMIEFDSNILKGGEVKMVSDDPHSKAMMEECSPFVVINGEKTLEMADANQKNINEN
ncbi:MAG: hypothetical protein ACYCQI_09645 [Gammaproteobacteria bacterium]